MSDWRWQFTRRRDDYQADWEMWSPLSAADSRRFYREVGKPPPSGHVTWDTVKFDSARMPDCNEKYGMGMLIDPKLDKVHSGVFAIGDAPAEYMTVSRRTSDQLRSKGVRLFAFDLNNPIPAQLKLAQNMLLDEQNEFHFETESRRIHKNKLNLYLRVLDARECKATFEYMGLTLLFGDREAKLEKGPDEMAAKAHQTWMAARRLMFNWPA